MKVRLMFPDHDVDTASPEMPSAATTVPDLELDTLWDAMSGGDAFVRDVVRAATLRPLQGVDVILHRQAVLDECRRDPSLLEALDEVAGRAVTVERRASTWIFDRSPTMSLTYAVSVLGLLVDDLRAIRTIADRYSGQVRSAGWSGLLTTIRSEITDDYLDVLRAEIDHLKLSDGVVHSAHVSATGLTIDLVLRRPRAENHRLLSHNPLHRPTLSWTVPDRDEAGSRAFGELRDRAILEVATTALHAAEHVKGFFEALRAELAFYRGCLNLTAALDATGGHWCLPVPVDGDHQLRCTGIYDPCLALRTRSRVVTNDLEIGGQHLLVISGANHGGKSTLLRTLGVAHLMAQAGMPVAADTCTLSLVRDVHTHWAREEDAGLRRGKLDEELERLSEIIGRVHPGSLVLSNESLSSTNESEGAAIALDVFRALADGGVLVYLVTHLYDLSRPMFDDTSRPAVFLRAPRQSSESARYRLEVGPPLPTSFGRDLYEEVFGTA
ncbi:MAG: MutS-related protein [Cellulomonas sp.]